VRQVGYLQELNRDARSTKHKIVQSRYLFVYSTVIFSETGLPWRKYVQTWTFHLATVKRFVTCIRCADIYWTTFMKLQDIYPCRFSCNGNVAVAELVRKSVIC